MDLFRYNTIAGQVQRVLMSSTAGAFFSSAAKQWDFADFTASCTFVQDAVGCTGQSFDIRTGGPGGTLGPEMTILDTVGYNENPAIAPEPATSTMLGLAFAAFGWIVRRRSRLPV